MRVGCCRLRKIAVLGSLVTVGAIVLTACHGSPPRPSQAVYGGDPEQGERLIYSYACGACHTIPGVSDARGNVGPPLVGFAKRRYIAGTLPNETESLIRWIVAPQAVEPGTAMPDLGVSEPEARHIAAYLYTLR